jgi:methyl-accepting chemotaxis protein
MVTALLVTSYLTREALETAAKDKLAVVLEARESALRQWADEQKEDLTIMAFAPGTIMFFRDLNTEFHKLGDNAQSLLQQNYLASERDYKTASPQPAIAAYDKAHRLATPFFSRSYNTYGWEDILLIDTQGNVVYSLLKETDFATNLRTGPWRDSGLAHAVMPLLQDTIPGQLSFSDFSQYAPSQMRPACFMAMPVFDEEKQQLLGIVAIQLPISRLNYLMTDKSGMGETGEVILVGKNGWMLTDSRFSKESVALKKQIFAKPSQTVLAGKTATMITPDYRGIKVIASVKPFTPFPTALGDKALWGIIAKIEQSEVLHEYHNLLRAFVFMTAGLILIALSLGIWGGRVITRPLLRITDALTRLAKSEHISVPELNRTDEIGAIAKAAETFRILAQQMEQEHWLNENVGSM